MHRLLSFYLGCLAVVLLLGDGQFAFSQATVTATAPATPSPAAAAPTAAPAAALPRPGIFSALGTRCQKCKARLKHSALGKLLKNAKGPLSTMTGGLVAPAGAHAAAHDPAGGPPPPPPPAVGAAAKIKKEQAAAAARREAVRYLSTVDCHWYPEAEKALIASLRTDRSECVRYEAALALNSGCCCTTGTIEALRIAAAGSNRDGNPGERSMRVRLAAYHALEHCLCNSPGEALEAAPYRSRPETPEQPLRRNDGEEVLGEAAHALPEYYERVANAPADAVLRNARRTLDALRPAPNGAAGVQGPTTVAASGQGSIAGIWAASASPTSQVASPTGPGVPSANDVPETLPVVHRPRPAASHSQRATRQHEAPPVQLRRLPHDEPEPVYLSREPSAPWR